MPLSTTWQRREDLHNFALAMGAFLTTLRTRTPIGFLSTARQRRENRPLEDKAPSGGDAALPARRQPCGGADRFRDFPYAA